MQHLSIAPQAVLIISANLANMPIVLLLFKKEKKEKKQIIYIYVNTHAHTYTHIHPAEGANKTARSPKRVENQKRSEEDIRNLEGYCCVKQR